MVKAAATTDRKAFRVSLVEHFGTESEQVAYDICQTMIL